MTTEQEAYLVLHESCPIEVGDKVRVLRKAISYKMGWNLPACSGTDRAVGTICTVTYDEGQFGFRLDGLHCFPWFVLELIEKAHPPIMVGSSEVSFHPDFVRIEGITEIPNATVRKISERLVDEWTYFQAKHNTEELYRVKPAGTDQKWSVKDAVWSKAADAWDMHRHREGNGCNEITREEAMNITGGVE